MTSAPVRDPIAGHLITPGNAAFLLIDYQPAQIAGGQPTLPDLAALLAEDKPRDRKE